MDSTSNIQKITPPITAIILITVRIFTMHNFDIIQSNIMIHPYV